jgi:hypothetical protein
MDAAFQPPGAAAAAWRRRAPRATPRPHSGDATASPASAHARREATTTGRPPARANRAGRSAGAAGGGGSGPHAPAAPPASSASTLL